MNIAKSQVTRKAVAELLAQLEVASLHPLAVAVEVDSFKCRLELASGSLELEAKEEAFYPYGRLRCLRAGRLDLLD